MTCQRLPGGYGHEKEDARKYAEWGIDYLKYDWCYSPQLQYSADIDMVKIGNTVYEAESPANTVENSAKVCNCPACSAGKKVGNIGNNQGTLTFNDVSAPANGSYDMTISYLNSYEENNIVSRYAFVSVNGGEPKKVGFMNTGGWDKTGTTSIKVDLQAGKNTIKFYNPWTNVDNAKYVYSHMRDELNKAYEGTGRSIVFSLCEWGSNQPWIWGEDVGNLWRTTGDISDNWASVMSILDQQNGLKSMQVLVIGMTLILLEVGNGGMTQTEYKAHFSLWSILAAPMISGNDIRSMSDETSKILMNKEVIAIDQDSLGVQGKKISDKGDQEVWVKPLANGDRAVLFLNRGNSTETMNVNSSEIGLPKASSYLLKDLWSNTEVVTADNIRASVGSHDVKMYRVKKGTPHMAAPATSFTFDGVKYAKPGETNTITTTLKNDGRIAIHNIKLNLQTPEGWTVKAASEVQFHNLPPGRSVEVKWAVTPPSDVKSGVYDMNVNASFVYENGKPASASSESSVKVPPAPPAANSYLSDVDWLSSTNGWGPVERDLSNGESKAKDGRSITIGGVQYTKGLGIHAQSEITYYVAGEFTKFTSEVGLDDEVGDKGTVVFQIWADDKKVYDSGVVTGAEQAKKVSADITGATELKLVVTNGGDTIDYDHADWANAYISK
jgi:alpha-galactosidase